MSPEEFKNTFCILYNNITSNQAPGMSDYEISVFLTKAQEELVKNHFRVNGNEAGVGFDNSEKRQIDFSNLVTTVTYPDSSNPPVHPLEAAVFDKRAGNQSVELPSDAMMVITETLDITRAVPTSVNSNGSISLTLMVSPIHYAEYQRLMAKPFKRPMKGQAWRLIIDGNKKSDLIAGCNDTITSYTARYVRKPKPILVGDLEGFTIEGYQYGTGTGKTLGCELDAILHEEVLQRAVELAKLAWQGDLQSTVEVGKRSE